MYACLCVRCVLFLVLFFGGARRFLVPTLVKRRLVKPQTITTGYLAIRQTNITRLVIRQTITISYLVITQTITTAILSDARPHMDYHSIMLLFGLKPVRYTATLRCLLPGPGPPERLRVRHALFGPQYYINFSFSIHGI